MAKTISLTRYLVEQQRQDGHIPSQLRLLLEVVARACKSISQAVNKGDLDAWILAANDRGSVGCLPEYRISLITQTDYSLDDEEEKDGYEYLFCFYDPDWTKSIMGRFRTIDDWKTIREHLTTWTSGVAREHGERAFRIPGTVLKPPLWYPPYP